MVKEVKIWHDEEGDFLEVLFERKKGFFKEASNNAIMEQVDENGNTIGFSILKVSALRGQKPLTLTLSNKAAQVEITKVISLLDFIGIELEIEDSLERCVDLLGFDPINQVIKDSI